MRPFLHVASWVYSLGLSCDRFLKTKSRTTLPRPVISIGNLTWGGTGKTPLVIKLALDLLQKGLAPAVLSRGYKGAFGGKTKSSVLENGSGTKRESFSDELLLMRKKLPGIMIGVGKNRVESADKILKRSQVDVFILDDGFQHWRLNRDLDIVCVDVKDPWQGGHLIPLGGLREKRSSLSRAGVIVLTRCELLEPDRLAFFQEEIHSLAPKALVLKNYFKFRLFDWAGREMNLSQILKNRDVIALSAIGHPQAFEENLALYGALVTPVRYLDHHVYAERELLNVQELALESNSLIVMTEKDEVKIRNTGWGQNPECSLSVLKIVPTFKSDDEKSWQEILSSYVKSN